MRKTWAVLAGVVVLALGAGARAEDKEKGATKDNVPPKGFTDWQPFDPTGKGVDVPDLGRFFWPR